MGSHPVLGDEENLLGPVAGGTVVPDDRFEHQHHPGGKDERRVERLTDVTSHIGHLGTVDTETVTEIEVGHPGLHTPGGVDGRRRQIRGCRSGTGDGEDGIHDRPPPFELRALPGIRRAPHDPRASEVGVEPGVTDADVGPQEVPLGRAHVRW